MRPEKKDNNPAAFTDRQLRAWMREYNLTHKKVRDLFLSEGVEGLVSRGLNDPTVVMVLGRDCIGRPDITETLVRAGWSFQRFTDAEAPIMDKESLAELQGRYYEIKFQIMTLG